MVAGALIVCLALTVIIRQAGRNTESLPEEEASDTVAEVEGTRWRIRHAELKPADISVMGHDEWREYFKEGGAGISEEYQQEILSLSQELAELRKVDPNGIEATVYIEAISALAAEKSSD